jgi:Protein of unknown function (DUF2905)
VGAPGLRPRRPHLRAVSPPMTRWLIVVFLALLLINALTPWLQKLGFGRLPGDIRFKIFGREIFIPLASTLILSLVCAGISKVL